MQAYFIIEYQGVAVISDNYASCGVTENAVSFNSRKRTATKDHSCSLIFIDVVFCNMYYAIVHNDPIIIVINLVVLYPTVTTLNDKYAFTSGGVYFVREYNSVA